jgi:hypothetical protein
MQPMTVPFVAARAAVIVCDMGDVHHCLTATQRVAKMANICVLARPYGIRQLVFLGKRSVLCRDLTDSFHRDPRGHLSLSRSDDDVSGRYSERGVALIAERA